MPENWIRVHAHLSDKPVSHRLSRICRGDVHKAIGHLVTFWGNVAEHASNGFVRDYPDTQLEKWAEWNGKRGEFAKWLRAEHMDPDGRVPEWDDYAGLLEIRRAYDRDRKREERLRKSQRMSARRPSDSPHDVTRTSRPTERNGTERYGTVRKEEPKSSSGREPDPGLTAVADAARELTIAANQAIMAKFGEASRPHNASGGPACALAQEVIADAIPIDFAQRSIVRQVRDSINAPPKSMNYFLPGIRDDWGRESSRDAATSSGKVPALDRVDAQRKKPTSFTEIVAARAAREKGA